MITTSRFISALVILCGVSAVGAQTGAQRSTRDGVFTEDQAKRGQDVYLDECSTCHAANLRGNESAKALIGDEFMAAWAGQTVGDIFERTRATMPQDSPGRLGPQQCADVIAFLLSSNELPSGSKELEHDAALLKQIRWETKVRPTP
ncbi:MAG: hypothetical protein A3F69_05150 [Acidobacteria bacterium RIFCSPLOWO2_12_FULL_66_10]|nr:MAG: hypothetical protein A3F69_05150 [Acidobacteria bacterium RIFCSPLOWO2_12_FULL_66_10]